MLKYKDKLFSLLMYMELFEVLAPVSVDEYTREYFYPYNYIIF